MSQDIAAVVLVLAAAMGPVAPTILAKLRTRRRRMLKQASGTGVRPGYAPRHLARSS